jgi:hypothetical protein
VSGICLVLNSWVSNLYRPARGRKRLIQSADRHEFIVVAEQEITGTKVTEVGHRALARRGCA